MGTVSGPAGCFCLVFALRSSMQLLGTIIEHHCHAHFILLHGGVYPAARSFIHLHHCFSMLSQHEHYE